MRRQAPKPATPPVPPEILDLADLLAQLAARRLVDAAERDHAKVPPTR